MAATHRPSRGLGLSSLSGKLRENICNANKLVASGYLVPKTANVCLLDGGNLSSTRPINCCYNATIALARTTRLKGKRQQGATVSSNTTTTTMHHSYSSCPPVLLHDLAYCLLLMLYFSNPASVSVPLPYYSNCILSCHVLCSPQSYYFSHSSLFLLTVPFACVSPPGNSAPPCTQSNPTIIPLLLTQTPSDPNPHSPSPQPKYQSIFLPAGRK